MLVAVINTDEQIKDTLEREFEGCEVDVDNETVIINGVKHMYCTEQVVNMPIDDITIYDVWEIPKES